MKDPMTKRKLVDLNAFGAAVAGSIQFPIVTMVLYNLSVPMKIAIFIAPFISGFIVCLIFGTLDSTFDLLHAKILEKRNEEHDINTEDDDFDDG